MHAAILAVNEALEKESSSETFAALSNPNTCIKKLEEENTERYHNTLLEAKKNKAEAAKEVSNICVRWENGRGNRDKVNKVAKVEAASAAFSAIVM